ncbi:Multidrug resistance efflux pump [Candidatus Accumulibacter aalborgensis]|uniref:Multidrug resistance efflux pump n=1 Tax=Candidatus Accumulibacter aalborgensis TaxID=1860102 RepID=A0A1A8XLM6_9PROT|nr:HlyD family efflux transporter periplasmic adaptor subunit [Candidatus Accumulibacter aalborgensis]SBT06050.1 Multidrug resistance efflux pump [Candidatus Accumulibacter aalborgensis]
MIHCPIPYWLLAAALAALLAACGHDQPAFFQGYVEGEYLYLAAPQAGYLKSLDSPRGSRVTEGQAVFAISRDPDSQTLAEAEARAGSARQKLKNLSEPRRLPEIAALEAQVRAADASLQLAQSQLRQQETLARQRFVSQARLDEATAARDRSAAELDAARQQLASFRISLGRQAEVSGAEADLEAAAAVAAQKRWLVERKAVSAPVAGEIADTYYQPGEWVPAGAPVASLLPDARRRLRFYVPAALIATVQPGQSVEARCDGCGEPIKATIDFIAPQVEYTPPVIYSRGSREKLVFRVEASPAPAQAATLRPGLPVDVRLAAN